MNIYSSALLQVVLISYPLVIYLFYNSYLKNDNEKLRSIILDISLFFSTYLIIIYSNIINYNYYIIINIPIILAYLLDRKKQGILLSILIIIYHYQMYDPNIINLIIEYFGYYLISIIYKKCKVTNYIFIFLIVIFKAILTISINLNNINLETIYNYTLQCVLFYIMSIYCFMLLEMGDKLKKYLTNIKEIEKEKQIRNIIFNITHEIKNPIAVCKGYLQMINVDEKEKCQKYINNIKSEIEKTLILLQDFLSLKKIQINKDIIDINVLLEENLEILENYAKTQNTKMEYELIDDEIYIDGDYNRLGQVIINIVKNSIEAINKKNGSIKVYTKLDEKNIYIYFVDNGKGISKENLGKIKKQNYSTKINGNGIGIILSNEIICAHQGELIYESKLGEGTTTIIKLPLYKIKESM